ncbi:winged helix-turn-helix domain-containing protein [Thermoproteota archaeon]
MSKEKTDDQELLGLPKIDKIIHEPARLIIVAHLYVVESADFLFLKRQTGMSWGNLSTHMSKLERVEYVKVSKEIVGKKISTSVQLTDEGRSAFEEYRENLRKVAEALW